MVDSVIGSILNFIIATVLLLVLVGTIFTMIPADVAYEYFKNELKTVTDVVQTFYTNPIAYFITGAVLVVTAQVITVNIKVTQHGSGVQAHNSKMYNELYTDLTKDLYAGNSKYD